MKLALRLIASTLFALALVPASYASIPDASVLPDDFVVDEWEDFDLEETMPAF